MKRIFTISVAAVMALLMVLSLAACGNSTLGYYKLTSAEASGMSFDSSTLAAVGMDKGYILLKEDGSGGVVVICGSLYLVGTFKTRLMEEKARCN